MACAPENEGHSSSLNQLTESEIHSLHLPDDIGKRWKDLARQLGFKEAFIDVTESDKYYNRECCIAVLVKWMQIEGQQGATREMLATALKNIGLQNLADRLIGPLNLYRNETMFIKLEKTIKSDDARQIMLVRESTGKKKFLLWESAEDEFETLFEELENSVDATIQISVDTGAETKIIKTFEVKNLGISKELERLQGKLSNIISDLEIRELKEESFSISNKLDLLIRHSRTLQELYTKVTGMTGEACKWDEVVRRNFYDFTYHSLRAVHNDLRALAAGLQSLPVTLEEEEKETLRKILSYQKGREKQVEHLGRLWIGLFTPTEPPLTKSQSSPLERELSKPPGDAKTKLPLTKSQSSPLEREPSKPPDDGKTKLPLTKSQSSPLERELGKPPSDAKNTRAYSDLTPSKGVSTKWIRSQKYTFTSTRGKSEDNSPILRSFSEAGKEK